VLTAAVVDTALGVFIFDLAAYILSVIISPIIEPNKTEKTTCKGVMNLINVTLMIPVGRDGKRTR
jgi:hypothetical protein